MKTITLEELFSERAEPLETIETHTTSYFMDSLSKLFDAPTRYLYGTFDDELLLIDYYECEDIRADMIRLLLTVGSQRAFRDTSELDMDKFVPVEIPASHKDFADEYLRKVGIDHSGTYQMWVLLHKNYFYFARNTQEKISLGILCEGAVLLEIEVDGSVAD